MSFHPQTPQSPSHLSPITSDPLSGASSVSFATTTNTVNTAGQGGGGSFSSSAAPTASTLPTPAQSVNGSGLGLMDMGAGEDSPHKRKRELDDAGDHESKKMYMEGQQRLDFEALHQDVGEKYLVCKTPHRPSFPPLSADLFSMFNLTGIAADVARTLPNGEKNAMRKTYKGYMKKLGVSGHFEPVKRDEGDESDFMRLITEAEDSWQARQVKTKEIRYGLQGDVEADLRQAMTMNKGPIPKAVWDSSVLGDLAPEKLLFIGAKPGSVRGTAPNTPLHPAVMARSSKAQPSPSFGTTGAAAAGGGPDLARPRRANKKRSYGDNSFEGYGEGFPDDDGGYSTGEGDGPNHKRRKKNSTPTTQYPVAPVRQQSYGPGMVGA
ncbi:mediator of RNA polymerase 2 transcription subunit 19 [Niveomyces insectorum RCEF 264]|uniref:Mediator of RNA polymerase II transcription subunit 19 n=1 Tax=Niveomyces insectorum RCEF 264 TaxID=1081102 RepID=A0A162MQY7_9HYPO|nr:mediator of RNA polymerase 2 transcription subunit 19 [Niveomyces insectorum RCEF 264]